MTRALLGLVLFVGIVSCQKKETSSTISIRLPDQIARTNDQKIRRLQSSTKSKWGVVAPQGMEEIRCWLVAVEYPEASKGSCLDIQGAVHLKPEVISGPHFSGETVSLEVTSGDRRRIVLIGQGTSANYRCAPGKMDRTDLSAPVVVGEATVDVRAADQSVDITASIVGSKILDDCNWLQFGISDHEVLPQVSISVLEQPSGETGNVILSVALDRVSSSVVSIGWKSVDGTAIASSDFLSGSGQLDFAPGETLKQISISLVDDLVAEALESFSVVFSNTINSRLLTSSVLIDIVDDDSSEIPETSPPAPDPNPPTASAPPTPPTSVVLYSPSTSPNYVVSPTIQVNGVSQGDTVHLYLGGGCETEIGTQVASGASVLFNISSLSEGSHLFSGRQSNDHGSSTCSSSVAIYVLDTTAPTLSLSSTSDSAVNGSFAISIVASEEVSGFSLSDLTAVGGTLSSLTTTDHTSFAAVVTPTSEGSVSISVAEAMLVDLAGNGNLASDPLLRTYDSTAPTVTQVTSTNSDGTYGAGNDIEINVHFSEDVTLSGSMILALNSSGAASYVSGSGSSTLTFQYTIAEGEFSSDLDYLTSGSLALSGTLVDHAGNSANLILPAVSGAGSLGANHDLVVSAPVTVLVEPVYVGNSDWNSYVRFTDSNSEVHEQPNASCDGTEVGYYGEINGCIHGGEKRMVEVAGFESCSGLTLVESLNALDWFCEDVSGTATFFSKGLKPGVGLGDLIASGGTWKTNSVTIHQGGNVVGQSVPTCWWTNPISALGANPSSLTDLNSAGTIYFVPPGGLTTLGIKISAHRVAVVSLGGGILRSTGATTNNFASGDCYASSSALAEMICSANQNFLWLETQINGTNGTWPLVVGMNLVGTKFSRLHKVIIKDLKNNSNSMAAIELGTTGYLSNSNLITSSNAEGVGKMGGARVSGSKNILHDFSVSRNTDLSSISQTLLMLTGSSSFNRLEEVRLSQMNAGSSSHGLKVLGPNNMLSGLTISNIKVAVSANASSAIYIASSGNIISQATLFGGSDAGIFLDGTTSLTDNIIQYVTAVNNTYNGIYLSGSVNGTYVHSLVTMNTDKGIQSPTGGGGTGNVFHDTVSANHGSFAVDLSGSQSVSFTGFFHKGSTANGCSGGGLDTACASGSVTTIATDLSSTFLGKVSSDTTNGSAPAGTSSYASIVDWMNFDSFFRGFGMDGLTFPNSSHQGPCISGTCRIWDWRVVTGKPLHNRSVTGTASNATFTSGSSCPDGVSGSDSTTMASKTFLLHAIEINGDQIGNNNSLCESGEACIYAPNMGSFQGEGALLQPCIFTDGVVSGVTVWAYSISGK